MTTGFSPNYHKRDAAIIGWDIGGVNLKAARLSFDGLQVALQPFAIWQQRDELVELLGAISDQLGPAERGAITITAELSDIFRTKREGIAFVLDAVQQALPETRLKVFGVDGQFHDLGTAYDRPLLVAAANWMATALLVSRHYPDCLLVDIGSTTTDIIPIAGGKVVARGRDDPERLLRGELLYTGALRTSIFAIVKRVPLWGDWCPVAAEHFATAQDVHLILGNLSPEKCQSPSADGRAATPEFAAERLARVVCADMEMLRLHEVEAMARYIAAEQIHQIGQAIAQVISNCNIQGPVIPVGVGAFLATVATSRLGLTCLSSSSLFEDESACAAPAVAIARLLSELDDV